jgi:hypothetical protein
MHCSVTDEEVEELRAFAVRFANDSAMPPDERRMCRILLGVIADRTGLLALVETRNRIIVRLAAERDSLQTAAERVVL